MNSLEIIKVMNKMIGNTRIIELTIDIEDLKKGIVIDKNPKK